MMHSVGAEGTLAAIFVALLVGHLFGDHIAQTDRIANSKGAPTAEDLEHGASRWAGWRSLWLHIASYGASQAVFLALVWLAGQASVWTVASALIGSVFTHAVIDRRWLVRLLAADRPLWKDAAYWIDQSLHYVAMFAATAVGVLLPSWKTTVLLVLLAWLAILAELTVEGMRPWALFRDPVASAGVTPEKDQNAST